ncbi:MAG TPA: DUF4351 domain-containing protein [Blastocatellia bacterium]|nr:DUF4351 domain-containing protein [Blastocatellia bacterium]
MTRTLAALTALRYIFTEGLTPRLKDIISLALQDEEQSGIEYLRTLLLYISAGAVYPPSVAQLKEALSTAIPDKEGELMQSFAETWLEEGRREGREEGLREGLREGVATTVLRQIHRRFGILDAETTSRIRVLPLEKLEQLSDALLDFTSRDDLTAWLSEHSSSET